jgi:hypothetical protein
VAYQATLQGFDVRYVEADTEFAKFALGSTAEQAALLRSYVEPDLLVLTICSSHAASATPPWPPPSSTGATSFVSFHWLPSERRSQQGKDRTNLCRSSATKECRSA